MAPAKQPSKAKRNQASNPNAEPDQDDNAPNTQDVENLDVVQLATASIRSSEIRREKRRQKIRTDYTSAMDTLSNNINVAFDNESKRISKTYKFRTQKLAAVLKRRAAIEEKIAASIELLDRAHVQFANELRLTVAGRMRVITGEDGAAASPAGGG